MFDACPSPPCRSFLTKQTKAAASPLATHFERTRRPNILHSLPCRSGTAHRNRSYCIVRIRRTPPIYSMTFVVVHLVSANWEDDVCRSLRGHSFWISVQVDAGSFVNEGTYVLADCSLCLACWLFARLCAPCSVLVRWP